MFTALSNGLGKSSSTASTDQDKMAKMVFASRIFLVFGLCLSKCSVLLTTRQLFTRDKTKVWVTCNIGIGIITACAVASSLAVSVACSPDHIIEQEENFHCGNDVLRLQLATTLDIFTELMIVAVPAVFIQPLRMSFRRKLLVLFAFSFRLPNAIFSSMYLLAYSQFIRSGDRGVAITPTMVWQEILLGYSFISATVPCIKGFVKSFKTGGLGDIGVDDLIGYGGGSIHMDSMKGSTLPLANKGEPRLRPEAIDYMASAYFEDVSQGDGSREDGLREDGSINSESSQRMIIRRHVNWQVKRD